MRGFLFMLTVAGWLVIATFGMAILLGVLMGLSR
jgi:hypothetical protein